jgi:tetratricopeptide (TPR) repeat protein
MDLENRYYAGAIAMKYHKIFFICSILFLYSLTASGGPQSNQSQKPGLIIDTDVADETENNQPDKPKERNPLKADQNISIGKNYLRQKNYVAAISRFLEALEYCPDSIPAHEALGTAYEKAGNISKALEVYNKFISDNPNSPNIEDFRAKIAKLNRKK